MSRLVYYIFNHLFKHLIEKLTMPSIVLIFLEKFYDLINNKYKNELYLFNS